MQTDKEQHHGTQTIYFNSIRGNFSPTHTTNAKY